MIYLHYTQHDRDTIHLRFYSHRYKDKGWVELNDSWLEIV